MKSRRDVFDQNLVVGQMKVNDRLGKIGIPWKRLGGIPVIASIPEGVAADAIRPRRSAFRGGKSVIVAFFFSSRPDTLWNRSCWVRPKDNSAESTQLTACLDGTRIPDTFPLSYTCLCLLIIEDPGPSGARSRLTVTRFAHAAQHLYVPQKNGSRSSQRTIHVHPDPPPPPYVPCFVSNSTS